MNRPAELLTLAGITRPLATWARLHGISRQLLRYRVRKGLAGAALLAPAGPRTRHPADAVAELRRRVDAGESVADAARATGISASWAREIAQGVARVDVEP